MGFSIFHNSRDAVDAEEVFSAFTALQGLSKKRFMEETKIIYKKYAGRFWPLSLS